MKKFYKIVITGGPCAGKTTGLETIEKELTKLGYKVVFINESATELINNGLSKEACSNNIDFESNIIELQIKKEEMYEKYCKALPNDKVILICDRGVMDCKSYTTPEEWIQIKDNLNTNEIFLRDNYDAVFHLVSSAIGAEEYYTIDNNKARVEKSLNDARDADYKTLSAWVGHPHLRAIDNSTNFIGKINKLLKEILNFLGDPEPVEIERKFLIKKPNLKNLISSHNCKKVDIIQTYLTNNEYENRRIRQRGLYGGYTYYLTTKSEISNSKRIENENRISQEEYLYLLNEADTNLHQVKKTRYCLMHNYKYYEIDIYPTAKETAILEIELLDENENINIPDFIEVIKEVTDDKRFSNYSIANHIPEELK